MVTKISELPDTQVVKSISGNAIFTGLVTTANEATDTTCFPLFVTASGTQNLQPKNNTALTFNSNTGALGVTSLVPTTPLGAAYGGTGVANNAASTLTISGNFASTFTVTGVTSVTFPTSGTLTTLATVVSTVNTYTAAQRSTLNSLTDAATVAIDLGLSGDYRLVMTSAIGATRVLGVPTNVGAGQYGKIIVKQDSGGSRALTYAWPYSFGGGTAPTLSTGKFTKDVLVYTVDFYGTATVTVTIATPAVMTWTSHGMSSGQKIQLTTTGALPTGLSAATSYWVNVIDANTFNLSTSLANLQAGTYIATSGSQSGVHTAVSMEITINPILGVA